MQAKDATDLISIEDAMSQLATCPFCGCWVNHSVSRHATIDGVGYAVMCGDPDCAAFGPMHRVPQEAIRLWNTRSI